MISRFVKAPVKLGVSSIAIDTMPLVSTPFFVKTLNYSCKIIFPLAEVDVIIQVPEANSQKVAPKVTTAKGRCGTR